VPNVTWQNATQLTCHPLRLRMDSSDLVHHLIHGSLDTQESVPQTASQSVPRFCAAHPRAQTANLLTLMAANGFLLSPNGNLTGSAVFAQHIHVTKSDRHADQATCDNCSNRRHPMHCMLVMRPTNVPATVTQSRICCRGTLHSLRGIAGDGRISQVRTQ